MPWPWTGSCESLTGQLDDGSRGSQYVAHGQLCRVCELRTAYPVGCDRMGFNWMPIKRRWCGVQFPSCPLSVAGVIQSSQSLCISQLTSNMITDDCFRSLIVSLIHRPTTLDLMMISSWSCYRQRRLQSVLNAAACIIQYRFPLRPHPRRSCNASMVAIFDLKRWTVVAVMALYGLATTYLDQLVRVTHLPGHRRKRSATSQLLQVLAGWHIALQLLAVAVFDRCIH